MATKQSTVERRGSDQVGETKVRIAVVIKGLGLGGAERIIADLVPLLAQNGLDITVLSTLRADALAHELSIQGIEVRFPTKNKLWPLWLLKELWQGDFKAVHTHSPLAASYVSALRPMLSWTRHWPDFTIDTAHTDIAAYNKWTRLANALTAKWRDSVIATSEISRLGVEGERVIHHGVPAVSNQPAPRTRSPEDPIRMVSVAGFRAQKDHQTLLRSCSILKKKGVDFKLDLIGDGPLRPSIEATLAGEQLADSVRLLGWRTDVREVLSQYDLYVLATHAEGFPIAMVEAVVAGLRCVGSDVPGVREVLTLTTGEICGGLADVADPVSLADALLAEVEALADDERQRLLDQRGKELNIFNTVEQYLDVYDSLMLRSTG